METKKSFTVIELLVVIAIIGLISSIILVSIREAREKARIAGGLELSQSIQHALGAYAVGIWKFEETGDTAIDSSGYQNHGTLGDGTCSPGTGNCPNWTSEGILGSALSFDGVDDYVDCGNDNSLDITGNVTIELWVKTTQNDSTWRPIIDKGGNCNLNLRGYSIYIYEGKYFFSTYNCSGIFGSFIANGNWHHIVCILNGGIWYLYLDGISDGFLYSSGNPQVTGNPLQISNYFNSTIDEVRIYNQALSTAQIQKHYAEGLDKHKLVEK